MGIDHWHKCPGHQDIQADKRDQVTHYRHVVMLEMISRQLIT